VYFGMLVFFSHTISRNSVLRELEKICSHPGTDLLKSILKVSNAWGKVWEAEEQLSVICILLVIHEREEITVLRGVVYMIKSRGPGTEPWDGRVVYMALLYLY